MAQDKEHNAIHSIARSPDRVHICANTQLKSSRKQSELDAVVQTR